MLPVDVRPAKAEPPPVAKPEVYEHGSAALGRGCARQGESKPQFAEPVAAAAGDHRSAAGHGPHSRAGPQRRAAGASTAFSDPKTNEWVVIAKSGVNIVVDGLDQFGSIDVDTDNLVIWTEGELLRDAEGQSVQSKDRPLEIYMEGNVVFRQGERTIYAQRMYYDVPPPDRHRAVGRNPHAGAQVRGADQAAGRRGAADRARSLPGSKRLAHVQPLRRARLRAAFQHDDLSTTCSSRAINPFTGHARGRRDRQPRSSIIEKLATSRNNFIYVEQVPVFYWPFMATDLDKPNYYIDSIRVKNDRVFGTQVLTDIDAYQVFGIRNKSPGTKWDLSADYLSKRGPAGGTTFNYERQTLFGVPESTSGFVDVWGIQDHGLDNLGFDRRT